MWLLVATRQPEPDDILRDSLGSGWVLGPIESISSLYLIEDNETLAARLLNNLQNQAELKEGERGYADAIAAATQVMSRLDATGQQKVLVRLNRLCHTSFSSLSDVQQHSGPKTSGR